MPRQIEITSEFITLGQLLKLAGFIGTGGEVRDFLAETSITVNGEPDNRRGRKIYSRDVVVVGSDAPITIVRKEQTSSEGIREEEWA